MLRYKNSLLERILVEKGRLSFSSTCQSFVDDEVGIDVQAELNSKTDGTHPGSHNIASAGASQPFPLQRSILNRPSQARRSTIGSISKAPSKSQSSSSTIPKQSPQLQATPRSQTISPTTAKSPGALVQGGMTSPGMELQAQQQPQPPRKNRNHAPRTHSGLANSTAAPSVQAMTPSSEMGSNGGGPKNYYASPFQSHIEQLGKLTRPLPFLKELCSS